ncbi:MAG: pyridoxal phosphate-dependent aminotransferase [Elusimicrobiota bacterium]
MRKSNDSDGTKAGGAPAALQPRACMRGKDLQRPDWTAGHGRPPGLLWLDKNENTDPELAALTADLLAKTDPRSVRFYPECGAVYRKLAKHLGVGADQLLLTAGSDGTIRSVFETFVDPGDVVLHTAPTFAMYPVYSRMFGAETTALEYERTDRGPSLPLSRLLEKIDRARPRLICLPNPDSPTGTAYSTDELARIVEAAGRAGSVLLIDEAYFLFSEMTAVPLTAGHDHVIVARTFAKAWGLAGLRIGCAVASPRTARMLHQVRPMYEVNSVAVEMVDRMLDHSDRVLEAVKRLQAGMAFFQDEMRALGFRTLPTHGNFFHVAFDRHAEAVHDELGKLALYRKDFDAPCLKGYSRFSAAPVESFRPLAAAVRAAVARGTRA